MSQVTYQICTNCVMDTTDSKIAFDDKGVCVHCNDFYRDVLPNWHTDEQGRNKLDKIVAKIKKSAKGKDFDCLLGISGGVDSSYLLHYAVKELGLKPFVFHVDGGWDAEFAVNNIKVMIDKLNLNLYTEVINWEEMKDLQLAFLKASVPHADIPQDHAFIATLYNYANKNNIKYILNGGNISTEGVKCPTEWLYYGSDTVQIKDIHNKFGTKPLNNYPLSPILKHKVYLRYVKGIRVVKPLNYIPYIQKEAVKLLSETYGWKEYSQKHYESIFTKFFEGYWLPVKFGYDKRKLNYSSLILTGQISRSEALKKLSVPAYDENKIADDFNFIATKLEISEDELQAYMKAPNKTYRDYKSQEQMFIIGAKLLKAFGVERTIKR